MLAGDKFIPEINIRQLGLTYSSCGQFTKTKERIQKYKEKGVSKYIYWNKSDKACFQYDMVSG